MTGAELLALRRDIGYRACDLHPDMGLETATKAADVIADILTYVFGRADRIEDWTAVNEFMEHAVRCYQGDAEDYE